MGTFSGKTFGVPLLEKIALTDISNVTTDVSPADNELLAYDTTTSEWINQTATEAGLATAQLDNLSSVAINTSLISDTNNTDDLGSLSKQWKNLYVTGLAYIDGLGENLDAGDFDITSIDTLWGYDAAIYIDMGADGVLDVVADTTMNIGSTVVTLNIGNTSVTTANVGTGATTSNFGAQGVVVIGGYGTVTINDVGADFDVIVKAVGVADALVVQGSDGQITLGALGAGLVLSSAGGVLSVITDSSTNWDAAYTHVSNDGSDHSFIDQDVTSGSTPTLTGTNITGVPAASILAGSFGTGSYIIDTNLTLNGTLNFTDTNTQVWEDGSGNMTFKDAVAGTITLSDMDCPKRIHIYSTGQSEGDLNLLDGTNWNTSKAVVKTIRVETSSTDWDLWILQNDNTFATDDAAFTKMQLVANASGNLDINLDHPYLDEDASAEVHLYYLDNSGANTANIDIIGVKAR